MSALDDYNERGGLSDHVYRGRVEVEHCEQFQMWEHELSQPDYYDYFFEEVTNDPVH